MRAVCRAPRPPRAGQSRARANERAAPRAPAPLSLLPRAASAPEPPSLLAGRVRDDIDIQMFILTPVSIVLLFPCLNDDGRVLSLVFVSAILLFMHTA